MIKIHYKEIAKAIYRKAREEGKDVRPMIREWITLFEESRVVGFNRDKFLECCLEEEKKK